jgi:hypothetical protein
VNGIRSREHSSLSRPTRRPDEPRRLLGGVALVWPWVRAMVERTTSSLLLQGLILLLIWIVGFFVWTVIDAHLQVKKEESEEERRTAEKAEVDQRIFNAQNYPNV